MIHFYFRLSVSMFHVTRSTSRDPPIHHMIWAPHDIITVTPTPTTCFKDLKSCVDLKPKKRPAYPKDQIDHSNHRQIGTICIFFSTLLILGIWTGCLTRNVTKDANDVEAYRWGVVLMIVTVIIDVSGVCISCGRRDEFFLVPKTSSRWIPLVLLPHLSYFREVHRIVRQRSLLVPVPELWHR